MTRMKQLILTALGLGLSIASSSAFSTTTITASGTDSGDGNALSASATFSVVGSDLFVTLQNTGAAASQPGDVLTAIFFSVNGNAAFTPVSATLTSGSSLYNSGAESGSIGGNWQYLTPISGAHGATSGISTTGLNIFGPSGNFGTPTAMLDGVGFGLVNGVAANANGGVKPRELVNNGLVFDLSLPAGFTLTDVSDVSFQYGTSSEEINLPGGGGPGVPDASSTLALLGPALIGLGLLRSRLNKN